MAVGMKRMVKRKVIVRKLDALEALGGVTNICSDKTGTLTQGKMVVRKSWVPHVGMYTVERSKDPSNPKSGSVRLGAAPTAQPDAEGEFQRKQEERDQARSALALKFADEPLGRSQRRAIEPEEPVEGGEEKSDLADGAVPEMIPAFEPLVQSAALCNIANIHFDTQKDKWVANGDPTEV